jgi:hypothetical protein
MFARIGIMRALNRQVESGSERPLLGPAETGEGPMTDQEQVISTLRLADHTISEYLEPGAARCRRNARPLDCRAGQSRLG